MDRLAFRLSSDRRLLSPTVAEARMLLRLVVDPLSPRFVNRAARRVQMLSVTAANTDSIVGHQAWTALAMTKRLTTFTGTRNDQRVCAWNTGAALRTVSQARPATTIPFRQLR